jgi:tetraacyldisaccharide 4'-kinase
LAAHVVSIGNLTVGGTGKTTAAMAVAKWVAQQGKRVAILSRGYRGAGESKSVLVSEGAGPLVDPEQAGDEAYLMAESLRGVGVLVGKDRRRTGRLAVEQLGAEVLVLDDGFQYQRLEKDLEIVLVDALAPFGYDFLVPRGMLREPPTHLARADSVWLTHSDLLRAADLAAIRARIEELAPDARIWEARHAPTRLRPLGGKAEEQCPEALRGRTVVAVSSIGNPTAFERTLEQAGAVVLGRARFPDHHRYRAEDLRGVAFGEAASAEWIVTTPKDAVRLPGECFDRPAWVLEVDLAPRAGRRSLAEELEWLLRARVEV